MHAYVANAKALDVLTLSFHVKKNLTYGSRLILQAGV